jgi:hypothetical protein
MTDGVQRRLARQFREAALLATPGEAVELDRLHRRYLAGGSATEISGEVRLLLRTQNDRVCLRTKLRRAHAVAAPNELRELRALETAISLRVVTVRDALGALDTLLQKPVTRSRLT